MPHLQEYIDRTKVLRGSHTQLFLTYLKPYNPASKDTISRWVELTMKLAGIDTNTFQAHSCRSASTTAAKTSGLTLEEILRSAGWSNETTIAKYYKKNIISKNFGQSSFGKVIRLIYYNITHFYTIRYGFWYTLYLEQFVIIYELLLAVIQLSINLLLLSRGTYMFRNYRALKSHRIT